MTTTLAPAELLAHFDDWEQANHRRRVLESVNLNAATNALSARARAALSASIADKGASGGPRSRHHLGSADVDRIEEAVTGLACQLFHGVDADLRPPTGSLANAIAITALVPRDRPIMVAGAEALSHYTVRDEGWGGRLTGGVVPLAFADNGVDLDLEQIARDVAEHRPAVIFVGSQAMLFPVDLPGLRQIADQVGARIVYDAAHPLGLMAGGQFQDPLLEGADIIAASTQKSLPGPVGGLLVTVDEQIADALYRAADLLLANYQNNRVLALGITLAEMTAFGHAYAERTVANAQFLAEQLQANDLPPAFADRGFTRSNQLLLPWTNKDESDAFARACATSNIAVSTIRLPSAPGIEAYGTRLGVQDVTRRGVTRAGLAELATVLAAIGHQRGEATHADRVRELAAQIQTVYYTFEHPRPDADVR
jgi:glycine hydroxymethyltransferase